MKGPSLFLLFCLCLLSSQSLLAASVVFLNPGRAAEPFWASYGHFMQAAADDLDMDLTILYAERDLRRMIEQARDTLQGNARPDYLVFVNEQYAGPEILRLAQGSGVKLFTVNSHLTADQQTLTGATREKYPDWIGSMVTNDEEAGYLMARSLLEQQERRSHGEPYDVLAFSGVKQTPASQYREQGLMRALAEFPDARLRQLVYAEWTRERAYVQAQQLLQRYPEVRVAWSANDEMAFGVMKAGEERGLKPGSDLLVSALNNSPEVLRSYLDGDISALVSGHFTLGGWAMVLLHDYDAGVDFAEHGGKDRVVPLFISLDRDKARRLLRHIERRGYDLDFRAYSLVGKPKARDYRFSLEPLID
ncbi:ABC transporter substrate-binding protein [Metapseudomonas resinovorans]|uniref:Putative ABC transporter substrate-binding protein n=1 Tax=Metapseudomonas resinovorans NBRC 106553 TaxID=1245471 RepID=S6AL10_METRE|nr:ABC transporter substrate-binding protein [Pseudomonas resinovorans]BAN49385.1 putative ABC transporter substrate-binding protein [Pseudomonas resinovorans NBRC 106553]